MTTAPAVPVASLQLDVQAEIERLTHFLRDAVLGSLRRRGAVVGCSGGVDSSVVLALCARALGPHRVLALLLPERESSAEGHHLARELADQLGVEAVTEDLTALLDGAGCYRRRDAAISRLVPDFAPSWSARIGLPGSLLDQDRLNVFYLTVTSPAGDERRLRMPPQEYLEVVAASNMKQRSRMLMLYFHAEARSYAVVGTAQKDEHDLGFFVKYGDGGVDVNPLQHLYKVQVFQLAQALALPAAIQQRTPATDTYPGGGSQEEFFYRLPFEVLDAIWHGTETGLSPARLAAALGLTLEQVEFVQADLRRKQRATSYLRQAVLTLEPGGPRAANGGE